MVNAHASLSQMIFFTSSSFVSQLILVAGIVVVTADVIAALPASFIISKINLRIVTATITVDVKRNRKWVNESFYIRYRIYGYLF